MMTNIDVCICTYIIYKAMFDQQNALLNYGAPRNYKYEQERKQNLHRNTAGNGKGK